MTLEDYHRLRTLPSPFGPIYVKKGARGFPDPTYELLARVAEVAPNEAVYDPNPGVGLVSYKAARSGARVKAREPSRAAFRALEKNAEAAGFSAEVGLPWEESGPFDKALAVLPAERGSRYTLALVKAAARAVAKGGLIFLAGSKKKGFERYFKEAKELIGFGKVLKREGPLRVGVIERERAPELGELWQEFSAELLGKRFVFKTLPGVFSEGRVDPASRLLLENLPPLEPGTPVLDLGAGYGALTLPLAAQGARVTALEDDLASVRSLSASLEANGLEARALHSDVDEALTEGERFRIVVMNPPFHVGGNVILDVAKAFVIAAHKRLEKGGRLFLVANPFLKYETLIVELFGNVEVVAEDRYKVLSAVR